MHGQAGRTIAGAAFHELFGNDMDGPRHGSAQTNSYSSAGAGTRGGLDEELGEDVLLLGANGLADADLPGALGYGDQHDVHNPDAADQEGKARNAAQDETENGEDAADSAEDVLLAVDFKARRVFVMAHEALPYLVH